VDDLPIGGDFAKPGFLFLHRLDKFLETALTGEKLLQKGLLTMLCRLNASLSQSNGQIPSADHIPNSSLVVKRR
jgi:hypothetical protein